MSKCRSLLIFIALMIAAATWAADEPTSPTPANTGGIRIVLQAKPGSLPKNPDARAHRMEAVVKVLMSRAKGLEGVTNPTVEREGDDRVVVELPGVTDKQAATATLTSMARLELYWLRDLETEKKPKGKWEMLDVKTDENGSDIYSFMNKSTKEVVKGDTPKGRERILLKVVNAYDPVRNPKGVKPILTGDDLLPNAKGTSSSFGHRPVILVEFNDKGTKIFHDFTKKHVGEIVAIFFGGRILTAPRIYEPIPTGKAEISGFSTLKEATDTARILNAGTLPVPLRVLSVTNL